MIHHISIPAQNPRRVAEVLAEIWQGKAVPFPPVPGSYMVFAGDEYGSAIEIYPLGIELIPGHGNEQVRFFENNFTSHFTPIHAAISVPTSQEQIERIGAREGWRVLRCNRDSLFDVIEFWIENSLMLEFLPPEIISQYIDAAQSENLQQIFANAN